jgi:hypothetical protein
MLPRADCHRNRSNMGNGSRPRFINIAGRFETDRQLKGIANAAIAFERVNWGETGH